MNISIIIPAFNEETFIQKSLERIQSACEAQEGVEWEYIVCDNNSTDATAQKAQESGAKVVFKEVNQISRARNAGASIATGDWLLFIDADSYPSQELMAEIIEAIRSEKYIGCGSTIEVEGGSLFNKLRMERLNPFFRLFNFCGGVFILVEKEAFDAIGGFSNKLYAYEEFDFVARLKRHGKKRGKKFTVLHRYPLITSGRKGDYTFSAMFTLIFSSISATFFFFLQYILPEKWMRGLKTRIFAYWYKGRR